MLFLVIEHFKNQDAKAVYSRFNEKGRMMPDGLRYIGSWTTTALDRCFQIMECDNPSLFEQWIGRWQDLIEFEIIPVMTGSEAAKAVFESGNSP